MFEWDREADQIDAWAEKLLSNQREINRLYSEQAELVGKLDPHQIASSSGDRNVTDWLSSTLDISHQTARRLRTLAYSPDYSLGRLYGMLEKRRRVSAEDFQTSFSDRYLVIQPSVSPPSERSERWGEYPEGGRGEPNP